MSATLYGTSKHGSKPHEINPAPTFSGHPWAKCGVAITTVLEHEPKRSEICKQCLRSIK